ncbi:MAG: hypothetical protein V3U56_14880, partial [Syntrophobacteria bacterium]
MTRDPNDRDYLLMFGWYARGVIVELYCSVTQVSLLREAEEVDRGQIKSGMPKALIIPVENQVRELDARLLLACVAARREISSIIGPKRDIESRIASFPRSIFLSKSL